MQVSSVGKYQVTHDNHQEFRGLVEEIFKSHHYYLDLPPTPRILDLGAHIGLSTLYFKQLYKDAEILAIEPHPDNYQLLLTNLGENIVAGVETRQVMVAAKPGKEKLYFDSTDDHWYSTAGMVNGAWNHRQISNSISVEAVTLCSLLDRHYDLVKMDIESAEWSVLPAAKACLENADHFLIELHPKEGVDPDSLQHLFVNLGYDVEIETESKYTDPARHLRLLSAVKRR